MIPRLNDIVGLPPSASVTEIDRASEEFFQKALGRASQGDADAQRELLALRVAYLNWAYANSGAASMTGNPKVLPVAWSKVGADDTPMTALPTP
jgi:hypothetical protein